MAVLNSWWRAQPVWMKVLVVFLLLTMLIVIGGLIPISSGGSVGPPTRG